MASYSAKQQVHAHPRRREDTDRSHRTRLFVSQHRLSSFLCFIEHNIHGSLNSCRQHAGRPTRLAARADKAPNAVLFVSSKLWHSTQGGSSWHSRNHQNSGRQPAGAYPRQSLWLLAPDLSQLFVDEKEHTRTKEETSPTCLFQQWTKTTSQECPSVSGCCTT